eukprot:1194308-Prorocentrum_minimum.AAC.1
MIKIIREYFGRESNSPAVERLNKGLTTRGGGPERVVTKHPQAGVLRIGVRPLQPFRPPRFYPFCFDDPLLASPVAPAIGPIVRLGFRISLDRALIIATTLPRPDKHGAPRGAGARPPQNKGGIELVGAESNGLSRA